jgi:DNA-binding GntR family transcriptional regulator
MSTSQFQAATNRIRAEYLEMPGMRLTVEQMQRLFGVERTVCLMLLEALVEAHFLCAYPDGTYGREHRP